MRVPMGTGTTRSSPLWPAIFLPLPSSPRGAFQWCRPAKSMRVFLVGSATKRTVPPLPPSPPSGPPLGMYFSRRNETQPGPPSPAFTWMVASSMNMGRKSEKARPGINFPSCLRPYVPSCLISGRSNVDLAALEFDLAVLEGEQRVVGANADVEAGAELSSTLADDDGAGGNGLAAVRLDAEVLRVGVAAVAG